jgi:hypothetical protein
MVSRDPDMVLNIIHGVDERMDLLPIDQHDEGHVNGLVAIVGHTIGGPFGVVDFLVVLGTQI